MSQEDHPVTQWIDTEKQVLFNNCYKIMTSAPLAGSSRIDKFSSYLLGAAGGAFALVLSKVDTITRFIDVHSLQTIVLLTLFPSIIFGVVQKLYATLVGIHIDSTKDTDDKMNAAVTAYCEKEDLMKQRLEQCDMTADTTPDFHSLVTRYCTNIPWWMKCFVTQKKLEKYYKDPLIIHETATRRLFSQGLHLVLQSVSLFTFFVWTITALTN